MQLGARDSPRGRGEACSWEWVPPSVAEMCCTATLEPWAAAAGGLGSSYWKIQQEGEEWRVQGAASDQGWGWQTGEGCGVEDLPSEAWSTATGPEELGRKWVVGRAGRSCLGERVGRAQRGRVQGLGVRELWPALGCRLVGESCRS